MKYCLHDHNEKMERNGSEKAWYNKKRTVVRYKEWQVNKLRLQAKDYSTKDRGFALFGEISAG